MASEDLAQIQAATAVTQAIAAAAVAALTIALVIATAYYAKQNRDMAREMRRAREQQVRPNLVPTVTFLGAGWGFLRIENLGPGGALHVDLTLNLEPGAWQRRWARPLVGVGNYHEFRVDDATGKTMSLDAITKAHSHFRIAGSCEDVLGNRHLIDDSVEIREAWQLAATAKERLPRDTLSDAVKALMGIGDSLDAIARYAAEAAPERPETGPEVMWLAKRITRRVKAKAEVRLRRILWRISARLPDD